MSALSEQNLAVLQGYFDAMAAGGPPAAMPFYHPEVELEVPGTHPASGSYRGHDGVGAFGAAMAGITNRTFRLRPLDLLASDDHVVTVAEASAEVAGRTMTWRRVIVSTVADGALRTLRFFEQDQREVDALFRGEPAPAASGESA